MNKCAFCVLLVMPLLFSSCNSRLFGGKKSKKKAETATLPKGDSLSTATLETTPVNTGLPVATPGNAAIINEVTPLWNKRFSYKTFTGKAKVSFEGPGNSADFSANFRIAKDSVIWAHISALGGIVSVARIMVTPDSFFMVNFQNKEITRIPLQDAARILPVAVQFSQLQNLFTGEPLGEGSIVNAESKDSSWTAYTEDTSFTQQVHYRKPDGTLTSGNLQSRKANGPQVLTNYFDYEQAGDRKLSSHRVIHIVNGVNNYNLDMNIVNPEFDKALEFPFTVPKNYAVKNY